MSFPATASGELEIDRLDALLRDVLIQCLVLSCEPDVEPDVLANGLTQAAFAKARALLIETAEARRDLDLKPELADNTRLNQRADDLRELGVAALIVALLLTCAEVLASGWYRLFLAVGVAGLVVSAILMLNVGFGT